MKEWINYVLQFGSLNPQQVSVLESRAEEIAIAADGYFSEAGTIARRVGFVTEGVLRVCYDDNRGEEITKYFIDENNLVVDLESFENNVPSSAYVQAITDCRLVVYAKPAWEDLLNTIVGWDAIVRKMTTKALLQKVERRSPLVSEDATTRYLSFMEKYPVLANRVPLSYLASYLGITQSSLSRIRKNIR